MQDKSCAMSKSCVDTISVLMEQMEADIPRLIAEGHASPEYAKKTVIVMKAVLMTVAEDIDRGEKAADIIEEMGFSLASVVLGMARNVAVSRGNHPDALLSMFLMTFETAILSGLDEGNRTIYSEAPPNG